MSGEASSLPRLPARPRAGHKGTFGTVAIVGGSCSEDRRMIGAPALAAHAALRAGAGLVRLVMPGPIIDSGVVLTPSATGVAMAVDDAGELEAHRAAEVIDRVLGDCHCMVIGMGLGTGKGAAAATLRAVQQEEVPLVIDADSLNCLASVPELWRDFRARAVLTPHPGEFKRLAATFKITHDPADVRSRPAAAEALAQRLGCIVVLKGAGTVVSDGLTTRVCAHGHPCLGTAGTGDVLAGLIGGLMAQFVRHATPSGGPTPGTMSLFDAAHVAAEAHGIAAEGWANRSHADAGLLARELADELPGVLEGFRIPG